MSKKLEIVMLYAAVGENLLDTPYEDGGEQFKFLSLDEECDGSLYVKMKNLKNKKTYDRFVHDNDSADFIHAIYMRIPRETKKWIKENDDGYAMAIKYAKQKNHED